MKQLYLIGIWVLAAGMALVLLLIDSSTFADLQSKLHDIPGRIFE